MLHEAAAAASTATACRQRRAEVKLRAVAAGVAAERAVAFIVRSSNAAGGLSTSTLDPGSWTPPGPHLDGDGAQGVGPRARADYGSTMHVGVLGPMEVTVDGR